MSGFVKIERPIARTPVQERSQERMARALTAAEKLLVELGPERASIPEIALAADVPRASIYQFYPDKFALFAHLAESQMERLRAHLLDTAHSDPGSGWRHVVRSAVEATATFYNTHPVASVLLLKGPFGEQDRQAHLRKDAELAIQFRRMIERDSNAPPLPTEPDVAVIAVELAFAILKFGYARDGLLSRSIVEETSRAAIAYLSAR